MDKEKTRQAAMPPKVVIVHAPKEVLTEAIKEKKWFEGVALSTAYLEEEVIRRLRIYLYRKHVKRPYAFLQGMHLSRASRILEKLDLIDHKTHSTIGEVNAYRNKIIHEERSPDAIDPEEAKGIIEKALKCLEAIIHSYRIEEE